MRLKMLTRAKTILKYSNPKIKTKYFCLTKQKTMKTMKISKREFEVLELISYAFSTPEIAKELFISYETAKTHRKNLLQKLNARNTAGLIRKAFENGLLKLNQSTKFSIAS